jgi:hypothetical protein
MTIRSYDEDDDSILADGESLRIPLMLMDGLPPELHDGIGNPVGHKPGYVFGGVTAAARQIVDDAYAQYETDLTEAWQQPAARGQHHQRPQQDRPSNDAAVSAYDDYVARLTSAWREGK